MAPNRYSKPPAKSGNATAFTRLKQQMQVVDLLFEVRDGRVPQSSKHPNIDELFGHKPRVTVFAKQDLADPAFLDAWIDIVSQEQERRALALSFKYHKGQDKLIAAALAMYKAKREAIEKKGLLPRPMRVSVVGLPNVGKSTLINWLVGRAKARTGDSPGITKGNQWVRVHPQIELLDTPGILPHVAFSPDALLKLALCNLIPADKYDHEEIAAFGLAMVKSLNPDGLKVYASPLVESEATLENLAVARSCVASGGRPDTRRAAALFLSDFRAGKLGRITLDRP